MEGILTQDLTCETPVTDDNAPPTKKTKEIGNTLESEGARITSCPFTNMPFDVLIEICQYLRPEDLVNLCDASPQCYRMLCTRSAAFIWVNCRELHGLYDIPDGMNEYYWAKLFYVTRCMECNIAEVQAPDFYMRKRLCGDCIPKKYANELNFEDDFGTDLDVLQYIPAAKADTYYSDRYCRDDIAEQLKVLLPLENDVLAGKRYAYRKLERYKASRRKILGIRKAEAEVFHTYHKMEVRRLRVQEEQEIRQRYQEVKRRFLDLGYLLEDLPESLHNPRFLRTSEKLTDKCWRSIRDEFEPELQSNKELRKQREWRVLVLARGRLLDKAYAAHKLRCIPPLLWKFLPQVHHLIKLQPFHDLIKCDKKRRITQDDFKPLLQKLDEITEPAYEEARTLLREQVLSSRLPLSSELRTSRNFRNLELATLVFRCTHCKLYLFGWDELKSHYCADPGLVLTDGQIKLGAQSAVDLEDFDASFPYTFEFCKNGRKAMLSILSVLGLDPANTTPFELDASGARFLCGHDHNDTVPNAFNWRGLATHLLDHHKRKFKQKTMPPPTKITPKNRQPSMNQVKRLEARIANDYAQWACAKCDSHLRSGRLEKPAYVKNHLKIHHAIARPKEGVDYVDLSDYKLFTELARGLSIGP